MRHSFLYLVPKVQNDGLMFLIPFNEEVDIIRTPGELRADLEAEAIDQGVDLYNEDIEYMQQIYYSMLEQIAISRKVYLLCDEDGNPIITESEDGEEAIPVWAAGIEAEAACEEEWETCKVMEIDFDEFLAEWIPDLAEDGIFILMILDDEDALDLESSEFDSDIQEVIADISKTRRNNVIPFPFS